jgi:hypothetical protein
MPDQNAGVLGAIEMLDNVIAAAKGARLLLTSEAVPEVRKTLPWGAIGDVTEGPSLDLNANILMAAMDLGWRPEDHSDLVMAITYEPDPGVRAKLFNAPLRATRWIQSEYALPCSCAYVGWFYGKWGVWAGMDEHSVKH